MGDADTPGAAPAEPFAPDMDISGPLAFCIYLCPSRNIFLDERTKPPRRLVTSDAEAHRRRRSVHSGNCGECLEARVTQFIFKRVPKIVISEDPLKMSSRSPDDPLKIFLRKDLLKMS